MFSSAGSTAGGVGEAMEGNDIAAAVASAVENGTEMVIELLEEQEQDDSEQDDSKQQEQDDSKEES